MTDLVALSKECLHKRPHIDHAPLGYRKHVGSHVWTMVQRRKVHHWKPITSLKFIMKKKQIEPLHSDFASSYHRGVYLNRTAVKIYSQMLAFEFYGSMNYLFVCFKVTYTPNLSFFWACSTPFMAGLWKTNCLLFSRIERLMVIEKSLLS